MLNAVVGIITILINRKNTDRSELLVTKLHSEEVRIQKVLLDINCF